MLADAFAAEAARFLRQRSTLFWGFCVVPLGVLAWNLGLDTYVYLHSGGPITAMSALARMNMRIDTGQQIASALQRADTAFFKIFFAVGAAGLFGNEYRWETWRLLCPRNSRVNLLLAKLSVYALACALSLLGLALAALVGAIWNAILNGAPLNVAPGFLRPVLGMFAISWTALMVQGALVAAVAVATRATTGALLAGVVFAFAQGIFSAILSPWEAPLRYFALVPELPAELLRGLVTGQDIAPNLAPSADRLPLAIAVLAGWILLLSGAAMLRFQRQDLPRE
jgi:ABC-2 type transport system permease protein